MIEVCGLTKRYGDTVAVDDLTFEVRPGVVTGFLGPNGAGKSTTMRIILGLDHPTAGRRWSTPAPTGRSATRSATSAPCSKPTPCTPVEPPATTFASRPAATASRWRVVDEVELAASTIATVMIAWSAAAVVAGGWSLIRRDTA